MGKYSSVSILDQMRLTYNRYFIKDCWAKLQTSNAVSYKTFKAIVLYFEWRQIRDADYQEPFEEFICVDDVFEALLGQPLTPVYVIEYIYSWAIIQLDILADYGDSERIGNFKRDFIAPMSNHQNCSAEILDKLVDIECLRNLYYITQHKNTSLEILTRMRKKYKDEEWVNECIDGGGYKESLLYDIDNAIAKLTK